VKTDKQGNSIKKFHLGALAGKPCPQVVWLVFLIFLPIVFSPVGLFAQSIAPNNALSNTQNSPDDDLYADTPVWRQAMGGASIGHPVAQVESVVIATDGGNLKSYSSQGKPLWDYYGRGRLTPYVSRSREGTSYIGRTNGLLVAVNRSGRFLWQINLKTPLVSRVLTGWDGRLFVFTDGKITCMTAAGYTLWSRTLEKKNALAPILDIAGGIILVQEDGEVLRFDPFGNAFSYSPVRLPGTAPTAPPVAAASLLIEGWGHSILLCYEDRHMELLYVALGYCESLRGKLDLPQAPVAAAGMNSAGLKAGGKKDEAAVLLSDGRLAILSLEKKEILITEPSHISAGEFSSKAAAPGPEDIDLFFDERGVFVLTKTGGSGFAADGRQLWLVRLKNAASIPSYGDDGILYSGGTDWILYAYRLEDRVRAKQRLLYGEAPDGNYSPGNPGPSSWADYHFRYEEKELEARFTEIRKAVKDGDVGASETEYIAWLEETAGSSMANPRAGNHPPVQVRYRTEAARILAFIGSRETIPFLAELFSKDPEVLVKAAAAEAIGKIGVDPEGLALKAFETALFPPSPFLGDETVLASIAGATGALCRFSGPPLSDAGVRLLTFLSGQDKPSRVRSRAEQELRSLKN